MPLPLTQLTTQLSHERLPSVRRRIGSTEQMVQPGTDLVNSLPSPLPALLPSQPEAAGEVAVAGVDSQTALVAVEARLVTMVTVTTRRNRRRRSMF